MLIRRTERTARRSALAQTLQDRSEGGLDRRTFLRRSGLVAGGVAPLRAPPPYTGRQAPTRPPPPPRAPGPTPRNNRPPPPRRCTGPPPDTQRVWGGPQTRPG